MRKFASATLDPISTFLSTIQQLFFLRFITIHDEHEGVFENPYQFPWLRKRKIGDVFGEIGGWLVISLLMMTLAPAYWVYTRVTKKIM